MTAQLNKEMNYGKMLLQEGNPLYEIWSKDRKKEVEYNQDRRPV